MPRQIASSPTRTRFSRIRTSRTDWEFCPRAALALGAARAPSCFAPTHFSVCPVTLFPRGNGERPRCKKGPPPDIEKAQVGDQHQQATNVRDHVTLALAHY